ALAQARVGAGDRRRDDRVVEREWAVRVADPPVAPVAPAAVIQRRRNGAAGARGCRPRRLCDAGPEAVEEVDPARGELRLSGEPDEADRRVQAGDRPEVVAGEMPCREL